MLFTDRRQLVLLLLPAALLLVVFALAPVVQVALYSFQDIDYAADTSRWVGLANYATLFGDWFFRVDIGNTVRFAVVASLVQVGLGTALALLLNREFRGRGAVLSVVVYPMMLSTLVCSAIWRSWFHHDAGVLNGALGWLGLPPVEWLSDPGLALWSVMLVDTWQWTPMTTLIVLAGLQSIPPEIVEAARTDGARPWVLLTRIVLPLVRGQIFLGLLLRLIDAFKLFDKVYALTGGGPGNATETMSMYVYQKGFKFFDVGLAAAASVVMMAIACGLCAVYAAQAMRGSAK